MVLYDVVRLIGDPDLRAALEKVAERLRSDLQVDAIALELFDDDGTVTRAISGDQGLLPDPEMLSGLSSELLAEGRIAQGTHTASPGRWVRIVPPHKTEGGDLRWPEDLHLVPIKYLGKSVGVLLLSHAPERPEFGPADDRLLSAVAVQLGIAVERRNLRQQATDAEVLRRADELKTALLNAVSHDLRTPLSSILASADSLLQKDVTWTEDEKDEFARAIGRESRRLNRIVGNLLDLSRIQGGSLRPEKDWYHLGALVDDVLGRLRPVTNQHLVSVHVQQDLPPVPLDYVEIDQVLSNLIENAAKYSPLGTEISVSARREGDSVRVEVSDHGPGIPAHLRPLLFKPFSRLEAGQLRPKGTGLGLAVARGLVEAHGGAIWIESAEGGGAVFAFTLPLGEQGEAAADGEKTA